MSDPTLFEENSKPATQPEQEVETEVEVDASTASPSAEPEGTTSSETRLEDLLSNIKNERGEPKYGDVTTALDALKHSQEYIPQLQSKYKELEDKYNQLVAQSQERESVEDIVSRLTSQEKPEQPEQPPTQKGFSEEDIQQLVSQHLEQRESAARVQANQRTVSDALRERYGDKAAEVLESKANELGLSRQDIGEWASRSPQAVLALFGSSTASSKPNTSSVSMPAHKATESTIPKPERSMLIGATAKQQSEYLAQVRKAIYAKHGITE